MMLTCAKKSSWSYSVWRRQKAKKRGIAVDETEGNSFAADRQLRSVDVGRTLNLPPAGNCSDDMFPLLNIDFAVVPVDLFVEFMT